MNAGAACVLAVLAGICVSAFSGELPGQRTAALQQSGSMHCRDKERVIFSCQVGREGKFVSLCAAPVFAGDEGYLQYRYGRPGAIELQFPSERSASLGKFRTAHYFRAKVDRRELTFSNGGVTYAVFSYFDNEDGKSRTETGIRVEGLGVNRVFICSGRVVDRLPLLEGVVSCDPDSPLNLNECATK